MSKPREWFISFEGDPERDVKRQSRLVSGIRFEPAFPDEELVHVREVTGENDCTISQLRFAIETIQSARNITQEPKLKAFLSEALEDLIGKPEGNDT